MPRKHHKHVRLASPDSVKPTWQSMAFMAVVTWIFGTKLIPHLLAKSAFLWAFAKVISIAAWVLAIIFAVGAVTAFFQSRESKSEAPLWRPGIEPRWNPGESKLSEFDVGEPTVLEKEWMRWGRSAGEVNVLRPDTWSLAVIDQIEWKRFEDLCCKFYQEKGIRAETTRLGADGGVDIRLFQDAADPARLTSIVQCKAWSQAVGVKPVRELRGVMAHEKVEKAFFMAPNGFTEDAKSFAAANRITLLDGRLFLAMLERLPSESAQRLLAFATHGDWTTPTCPNCGVKMVVRDSRRGRFWGCPSYPRCRGMLSMRSAKTS